MNKPLDSGEGECDYDSEFAKYILEWLSLHFAIIGWFTMKKIFIVIGEGRE